MKETRRVAFNLGHSKLGIATRLLETLNLLESAEMPLGVLGGFCMVELDLQDHRLPLLLDELRELNAEPTILALRKFSVKELDEFPWLRLILKTASGLDGGVHFDQLYDDRTACNSCGAGVVPLPPLRVDLSRMGQTQMARLAYEGHLVVTTDLASALTREGLTGIQFLPVCRGQKCLPDERFQWMKILSEWSQMTPKSVIQKDEPCPKCERAGHFDTSDRVTEFHYGNPPQTSQDFALTWEYFSYWRLEKDGPQRNVGGSREIIVSQRARRTLRHLKVKRLEFAPLYFDALQSTGSRG